MGEDNNHIHLGDGSLYYKDPISKSWVPIGDVKSVEISDNSYIPKYKQNFPKCGEEKDGMDINDYIPFTGGLAWSNPYEITKYERKLSCTDGDTSEIEILCRDSKVYVDLCHFIKSLHCDELMNSTSDIHRNYYARIYIETRHQPLAASIKKFVDDVNRMHFQTKTLNKPVFQYNFHDAVPLGQVEEVKIDPKGIKFTCNMSYGGRAFITKEMKDNMIGYKLCPVPKKIIFSGPKCIVLWLDGTKTIVSCSENDQWDEYAAYCAALAKKIYGTTSAVHRMVDKKSNAKEYREAQEVSAHIDTAHGLGKALAEAMYKAMAPFIKEDDNDEHSEH